MLRRLVVIGVAAAVAAGGMSAGAWAQPSGPGPGNSANAKACQKGKWDTDWVREDGTAFTSQEDCVSYAAEGGKLTPKPAGLTLIQRWGQVCEAVYDGQSSYWSFSTGSRAYECQTVGRETFISQSAADEMAALCQEAGGTHSAYGTDRVILAVFCQPPDGEPF